MISLSQLVPSKCNMRAINTTDDISDLISSIKSQGILNPLLVRPITTDKSKYEVYAGHRRLQAARELNLNEVPCLVNEVSDIEAQVISLVENYQRLEPGYYDKIKTFQRIYRNLGEFDTTGVTIGNGCLNTSFETGRVNSLCSLVGVKPKTLKRYLRLAGLPDAILRRIDRDNTRDEDGVENKSKVYLTLKNAELLLTIPEEFQVELVDAMSTSELSGTEMEMVIRSFIKTPKCEMIADYINTALEKSQQNRRQKAIVIDNNPNIDVEIVNNSNRETENSSQVDDGQVETIPKDHDSDKGDSSQTKNGDAKTGGEEEVKVSKKNPWLYDPKDNRRKPRAIPPEQIEAFWDLYQRLNPTDC